MTVQEARTDGALRAVFALHGEHSAPYLFPTDFETWKRSLLQDVDGGGRTLFTWQRVLTCEEDGRLLGFAQIGRTAFGFDAQGRLSPDVSHRVLRLLAFDPAHPDAGGALLDEALRVLGREERVHAFFHYFGMTCCARHGKLFEGQAHVAALLAQAGFTVEHENIYDSARLAPAKQDPGVRIAWGEASPGGVREGAFSVDGVCVGECEVHELPEQGAAYLRWLGIAADRRDRGLGTRCLRALMAELAARGFARLDTDTALGNARAQHVYEKTGFARMGVTRSYMLG